MFASFEWGAWIARSPILNAVWIGIVALLMVSTIPTFSLKRIRIPIPHVIPTLLGVGLMTAFLTTAPWATLMVVGVAYFASIPLTVRASRRLRRDHETGHDSGREQAAERRKSAAAGSPAPPIAPKPAPPIARDDGAPISEWKHERRMPQEPTQ
jgi:CDP-diacylglycerol--serine O-phosphatidyltransferase